MLVEHGFTRATLVDGTEYTFTPSLGRVAALGSPRRIVQTYAALHGPAAASTAAEVLAAFSDQDDITALVGWLEMPEAGPARDDFTLAAPAPQAGTWKPGAMPEAEQVLIARHLMQHAVCGEARPDADSGERGQYAAEFHVAEHVAAARVHLGLSAADALACSMTELQQLFEAKFPSEEERKRRNAPSLAELEATERDVAEADARRAAQVEAG